MKKRELDSIHDIYLEIIRRFHSAKRLIGKNGGLGVTIRKLTAKILWFSMLSLLLSLFVHILYSVGIVIAIFSINLIFEGFKNIFHEKLSWFIYGKFFDSFSIRLINKFIMGALVFFTAFIVFWPKLNSLNWGNRNEK